MIQQKRKATWSRTYAKARDALTASRREKRREEIERKALVAAEDDAAFAAESVRADAQALFTSIQEAWDRDDREALARMVAPDLMAEWRLRLEDFASKGWRNHVRIVASEVEYVGMTNRPEDEEDRVVVRVSAQLEDYVDGPRRRPHHPQRQHRHRVVPARVLDARQGARAAGPCSRSSRTRRASTSSTRRSRPTRARTGA